uniref:lysM domain receptor-like kinase 3 n=1 Tax=Erigeron canadensis TaxID=72917 RepID=UPI001CB9946E|nr:lysM domain receptor-like kinase 3 [Erigeron canadensis]
MLHNFRLRGLRLQILLSVVFLFIYFASLVQSSCSRASSCLALGSYYIENGNNLTSISQYMNTDINTIISYNRGTIPNQDYIPSDVRINVPFECDCINGDFLGHKFTYGIKSQDTYEVVAEQRYANLTNVDWIQRFNDYNANRIPDTGTLNVTVNCSCGDKDVSKDYGLFLTFPLRTGESLSSVASAANLSEDLVRRYNPNADFGAGRGLVFIPGRDENGNYPPLKSSSGISGGTIAGIVVAVLAGVLLLAGCLYYGIYKKKRGETSSALLKNAQVQLMQSSQGPNGTSVGGSDSSGLPAGTSPGLTGITVDKSVEFSYEELSSATDDFSLANKIGQGGFGAVYYAELRGEKAAIKKMDMQASREFLAELKVLTHVHHLNLVRLIGYCVEGSLFLVYEYIENGNLSQHLHGSGRDPLPWSTRVQIALDSARGLEYIHEHTVPVYIHRDIKTANILIDKNFHGKVADFGLTKLTEVGSTSLPTRLVGTFGYMPPEYAQYGDVSPKIDVYAFGVVLYELISAKEAIVKANGSVTESKGLVAMFEEVLSQPDPKDDLVKMIDPRLGDNYPLDSVRKMAQLAKACTHENPQLRPSMRSIVVALMTLSSSTEDWDVGSFYENQTLVSLMSGR